LPNPPVEDAAGGEAEKSLRYDQKIAKTVPNESPLLSVVEV
jgi:hypothetical protein